MAASTKIPTKPATESKAGGIARATGLMMAMVLLSRILGVLRDAIISHVFGRGAGTDAYNAAFTVPDLLFYLLQSGALSSTIVPIITEYRQHGKDRSAEDTVNIVASTIFVVIGIVIALMWWKARLLTIWLNPGFDQHRIDLAIPLTRVLLPAQMFFFLGGLMMGVLYSRKQFLIPAAGPVIYNAGIITGGLIGGFVIKSLGIHGLVLGAICGAFVGNFLLPLIFVLKSGHRFRFSLAVMHPAAKKVWMMLLPMGLGIALPNIDQIVNKMFASYMGTGATTAMMNAYRLMLLPIGIFAQAMALAIYPTLSSHAAEKNIKAMRGTMNQSLRNILFLTVPASVLMYILASPVITFLLQSGKYTPADTAATAMVLRALSIGIFAWSTQSLLTRGFYALQNSRVPVASGIVVSVIFVFMNWFVLHHTHLGVAGLGYATTIAATIHATALLILLSYRLRGMHGPWLLGSAAETTFATIVLGAVTWAMSNGTQHVLHTYVSPWFLQAFDHSLPPKLTALTILLVAGFSGIGAFILVAKALRMPELKAAIALVKRRPKRKSANVAAVEEDPEGAPV